MNNRNLIYSVFATICLYSPFAYAQTRPVFQDTTKTVAERVNDLMQRMTPEEKIAQLQSQMLFDPNDPNWDYAQGNARDIAHFLHTNGPVTPATCAAAVNEHVRRSIAAGRFGIPVLNHEEGLHGAQWGMATVFPQSIAMAATFDDSLYYKEGQAIARELRAVGVRQVLAPVINVARDPRWGRVEETYGEDVFLTARMGVAFTKAMQQSGVIATPKHFVDNYGAGGHDSYASETSWRALRETYLEPFRACIQEGGAQSIMTAYNSVDGLPASCNGYLLNSILRKEWGFKGFIVSDYGAVKGVAFAHQVASSYPEAQAQSLQAGLDVELPNGYLDLPGLLKSGQVNQRDIDESVRRVLTAKISIGLFDHPYADTGAAKNIVRSAQHTKLALVAAREAMTLLKNDHHVLPLLKDSIKRIGVFGPAADILSMGDYTGPFGGWKGEGAVTPLQGLKALVGNNAEVLLYQPGTNLAVFAKSCDVLIFFASIQEGEAQDRSQLTLPSLKQKTAEGNANAIIVENQQAPDIKFDQEAMIRALAATGKKTIVVLQNGSPIDMSNWLISADAVLEAWYPSEQGGTAIAETLFGQNNPAGRLPISWPKNSGQVPIYYAVKPSGRSNAYIDDDGEPLYPFGYGLSYTYFSYSKLILPQGVKKNEDATIKVTVRNVGSRQGTKSCSCTCTRNNARLCGRLKS